MKSNPLYHAGRHVLSIVLLSLIIIVGALANISVAKAATKTATAPYYLETYTEYQGNNTIQYKVHQYPTLTQTDSTSQGYNYPSQSVNMGWVDVYVNGTFKTNLAGTVDQWDKDQGSTYLTRNSDVNLTDAGSYFQPNSLVASFDGWWPNDGGAWDYVNSGIRGCNLTTPATESPWGDLESTEQCVNSGPPGGSTYYLNGYDRHTGQYIFLPWSSPDAQAFGHAIWQEDTGITSMYQNLHTSDQAVAIPAMPVHFGPSTFSNPAFLTSYNATRKAITSALSPSVSRTSVRPSFAVSLAIAVGLIAIGFVFTAVGGYLATACLGQTDTGCLGKHTAVWNRVGAVMAVIGGGMMFVGSLHPALGPTIWGARGALAGGAVAAEGVELAAAVGSTTLAANTTTAVVAEEALIVETFLASLA